MVVSAEIANVGDATAVFRVKPTFRLLGQAHDRGRNYVNAFTLAPGRARRWTYADPYVRKGFAETPIVRCAPFVDAYVVRPEAD